jgi:hypothetical protein
MNSNLPTLALKGLEGNALPHLGIIQTWIAAHYEIIQLCWWIILGIVLVTLLLKLLREYLSRE